MSTGNFWKYEWALLPQLFWDVCCWHIRRQCGHEFEYVLGPVWSWEVRWRTRRYYAGVHRGMYVLGRIFLSSRQHQRQWRSMRSRQLLYWGVSRQHSVPCGQVRWHFRVTQLNCMHAVQQRTTRVLLCTGQYTSLRVDVPAGLLLFGWPAGQNALPRRAVWKRNGSVKQHVQRRIFGGPGPVLCYNLCRSSWRFVPPGLLLRRRGKLAGAVHLRGR